MNEFNHWFYLFRSSLDDYDVARQQAKRAEDTSNLESNEELSTKRRRQPKKKDAVLTQSKGKKFDVSDSGEDSDSSDGSHQEPLILPPDNSLLDGVSSLKTGI